MFNSQLATRSSGFWELGTSGYGGVLRNIDHMVGKKRQKMGIKRVASPFSYPLLLQSLKSNY